MRKYKVECLDCSESDILTIDEMKHQVIDYEKKIKTPFRSFRWRGDLSWGFFCKCGNDNRLANAEAKDFDKLVDGDPISLKNITASLLRKDKEQFKMEAV